MGAPGLGGLIPNARGLVVEPHIEVEGGEATQKERAYLNQVFSFILRCSVPRLFRYGAPFARVRILLSRPGGCCEVLVGVFDSGFYFRF